MRAQQGGDHLVVRPEAAVDDHALGPARGGRHVAATGVSGEHLSPALADRGAERVHERLVAAADPAHHLVPGVVPRAGRAPHARPQVGGGQVVVAAVELRVEQRPPEALPEPRRPPTRRIHGSIGSRRACPGRRSCRQRATKTPSRARSRAPQAREARAAPAAWTSRRGEPSWKKPTPSRPPADRVLQPELPRELDHARCR